MKKVILFFSLFFIISCSNDEMIKNEEVNSINKTSKREVNENEIDIVFKEYIMSEEYINSKESLIEFNSYLNPNFNWSTYSKDNDPVGFIESNITLTKFKSKKEIETKWNTLVKNKYTEIKKFEHIVNIIAKADELKLVYIFDTYLFPNNETKSDCKKQFDSCVSSASKTYQNSIKQSFLIENSTSRASYIATADSYLLIDMQLCGTNFDNCKGIN